MRERRRCLDQANLQRQRKSRCQEEQSIEADSNDLRNLRWLRGRAVSLNEAVYSIAETGFERG